MTASTAPRYWNPFVGGQRQLEVGVAGDEQAAVRVGT